MFNVCMTRIPETWQQIQSSRVGQKDKNRDNDDKKTRGETGTWTSVMSSVPTRSSESVLMIRSVLQVKTEGERRGQVDSRDMETRQGQGQEQV